MEELLAQISTIAKGMWRFRWLALGVAWLVAIVGSVVVYKVPDKFEATARIFVDTQSILKPLMSGLTIQPNIEQQVTMLSRTLISRPNVEKLVRMADLDLTSESKAQHEALVASLTNSLEIKNVGRDNLYVLSYRDSEPGRAQRVVQSLVSIFIESSQGVTRNDNESARVFLNEQIKSYQTKLEEAEAKLKDFRIRNLQIQAGDGKDSASRVNEISEQLNQAKLALREAEQARDAAKVQLESGDGVQGDGKALPDLLAGPATVSVATPEIDARIDVQRRNLDALLQRFTDQHPDIVSSRRLINDLEEQKRKEVNELRRVALAKPAVAVGGASSSLANQEMGRMLATSEVQVAALKARVAEYSSRLAQARESLKTAPQLEAEASQLNRDYAINKKNYEELVTRRESASMSGELEVASGMAEFRLIDPPRVSPKPVSPDRLMLLAGVFVLALGSGLFTAFAGSQLRPVFHSAAELRDKAGIPLLGVVSLVAGTAEIRKERMSAMRFMLGTGGLLALFVLALAVVSILAARRAG